MNIKTLFKIENWPTWKQVLFLPYIIYRFSQYGWKMWKLNKHKYLAKESKNNCGGE